MHSAHEVGAMQKVHDTTVAHGARCNSMAAMSAERQEFSMDEERQSFLKWLFGGSTRPAGEIAPAAFGVVGQAAVGASQGQHDRAKRGRVARAKTKGGRAS